MRYMMKIIYDGTNFSGWQKQENATTIQGTLENALKILLKEDISCVASGRTDAKVSAYLQPVHFDTTKMIDKTKLKNSLNGILPQDIKVLNIVETNLHARFSAKKKTYLYKMYISNVDLPLLKDALKISPTIDIKLMKKFIKKLKGTHDFSGFKASGSEVETNVRTIYKAKLVKKGMYLLFYITGNGFLYKMVRNIVGTMLNVGEKRIDFNFLKQHLFDDYKSTFTAKPDFLYLLNVEYQ